MNRSKSRGINVREVKNLPVKNLNGKVVGTRVRLANGEQPWALIGNIVTDNARFTEHFLSMSIEHSGTWFHLARYHDFDYAARGPEALATFLSLPLEEVFPITFDLRDYAEGDPAALAGAVLSSPRERLSRAEIIAMAVR